MLQTWAWIIRASNVGSEHPIDLAGEGRSMVHQLWSIVMDYPTGHGSALDSEGRWF